MVRRWKAGQRELRVDFPDFVTWSEEELRAQDQMFANLELDSMNFELSASPFGSPLYGRSPAELLLLAIIAAHSTGNTQRSAEQIANDRQQRLQKAMPHIFRMNALRDRDSETVYEIVFEIHRRELMQAAGKTGRQRGAGSASTRSVTREVLLRRDPALGDNEGLLEARVENVRKKVSKNYDFYVKHIGERDSWSEGEVFLALREIQERLVFLGINMDLDALRAPDSSQEQLTVSVSSRKRSKR
jgi:hypothetical protein